MISSFWNSAFPLVVCLSRGFPPTPPSVTVQSLAATAIRLKCTLQFKPAHQSRASSAVTVASNICTTKESWFINPPPSSPSLSFTAFPFHCDSSSPAFVLGPKIPFYPCDPPPLCTNLLAPIGLTASVLPLTARRPRHPAPHRTLITVWPPLQALLLLFCLAWMKHG